MNILEVEKFSEEESNKIFGKYLVDDPKYLTKEIE